MWTLLLLGMIDASPSGVLEFHQVDFPTEQLCMAAKAQIAKDFKVALAGNEVRATKNLVGSCLKRQ